MELQKIFQELPFNISKCIILRFQLHKLHYGSTTPSQPSERPFSLAHEFN